MEEAKIDGLKYRINFGLLKQDLDLCERKEMLTWIVNDWGIHITGLRLNLNGNEDFLLEELFKFPHLEMLHLGEDTKAFRPIRRSRDLVIEKELIARHANSLTKLSVGYEGRLPLKINLPHIEEVKFRLLGNSINSLLLACRKSVKRIEFDGCHSYGGISKVKLPNLLHISIRRCDRQFYQFAEQYAKQLTTLKLVGVDDVYYRDRFSLKSVMFINLTHLWIGEVDQKFCWKFIKDCSSKLEHLVVDLYYADSRDDSNVEEERDELNFPKLLSFVGSWEELNSENLEFLCISREDTSFFRGNKLDEILEKYPNLKTLLLPDCFKDAVVAISKLSAKSPTKYSWEFSYKGVQVLTLKEQCNIAMKLKAKEFFDLVPIIGDNRYTYGHY